MQEKFEDFDNLPVDMKKEIIDWLPISGVYHSLFVSQQNSGFFKPVLDSRKSLYDFLHAINRGEHDKIKTFLEQNIHLLVARDQVTDCSGRTFESISGFEYALWALDKHMWTMMIKCIPQNEEGKKIFEILLAQYNNVNKNGVTYRLNGKTITEKHFDFKNTIIKELQTQYGLKKVSGIKNWAAIDKQWKEGVGRAQNLFPMHVVYEYCSDEPFYPVPKFTSQPKSSKQFYNWTTSKFEDWFSIDSKLGSEFALYKGPFEESCLGVGGGDATSGLDLAAMTALCEVRTLDLINLKSQLEEQAGVENHYQVVAM